MADNDLNEVFEETMIDATVITVPIDDTLSNSGEAADAKAVGDALALKADASSVVTITVNGESPDNQGAIIIDGEDINMSGSDTTTLKAAITAAAGRTAADIPMSSAAGASTISAAISELTSEIGGKTATDILMASGSSTTIAQKISSMDTVAGANSSAITALQAKAGDTIKLAAGGDQTIKEAIEERVLTVNNEPPDETGNVAVTHSLTADNLTSNASQTSVGEWTRRTAGGAASISDGPAWLSSVRGNRSHVGYVPEVLNMTVTTAPREPGQDPITAELDRDIFVAYVENSGTISLVYTSDWSADPELYGVYVEGTPVSGDQITIVYTKENRGTIIQSKPEKLVATGYNIFNPTAGYAIGLKYSNDYGFAISGTYTAVKWAATATATSKTTLDPVDGLFNIPSNGYIFVEGSSTDTMVFMTHSDWILSTDWPDYAAYSESEIDMSDLFDESDVTAPFPYGLLRAGEIRDEINFNTGMAISNVERLAYSAENLAAAVASGRVYECDTNYIYLERASAVSTEIETEGNYTVSDHGLEYFTTTSVPVYATVIYGNNLKNKLERDVLTISQQTLTSAQQGQVRTNIGAASASDVTTLTDNVKKLNTTSPYATQIDPDNYTTTGSFHVGIPSNKSMISGSAAYGILEVYSTSSATVQEFRKYDDNTCWTRSKDGSSAWTSWKLVSTGCKCTTYDVAANGSMTIPLKEKSYIITMMCSSNEAARIIFITKLGSYYKLLQLAAGTYQSYYSETFNQTTWGITATYRTVVQVLELGQN